MPRKRIKPASSSAIAHSKSTKRRKTYHIRNFLLPKSLLSYAGLRGLEGMGLSNYISVVLYALTQLFGATAFAQQLVLVPGADCLVDEPDSVQISWVEPCENGNWLFD